MATLFDENGTEHDSETGEVIRPGDNQAYEKELRAFAERIRNLEEVRKQLGEDITSVFSEAKRKGYNVKALKRTLALAKADRETRVDVSKYADVMGLWD
jgi:uncharacterized protein (UPF0335 family)